MLAEARPIFSFEQVYGAIVIGAQASFALFAATALAKTSGDSSLIAAVVGASLAQGPLIGIWAVVGPGQRWRRIVEAVGMFLILIACLGQGTHWQGDKLPDLDWQALLVVHGGSIITCAVAIGVWRWFSQCRLAAEHDTPSRNQFSLRFVLLLMLVSCVILAWMRVLPWALLLDNWQEELGWKIFGMCVSGVLLMLPSIPFVIGAFRHESCREWFFGAYAIPIVCVLLFLVAVLLFAQVNLRAVPIQPVMELFFGYTFFALNLGATLLSIRSFGYRWQHPVATHVVA